MRQRNEEKGGGMQMELRKMSAQERKTTKGG